MFHLTTQELERKASLFDLETRIDKESTAQPPASFRLPNEVSCPQSIWGSETAANNILRLLRYKYGG